MKTVNERIALYTDRAAAYVEACVASLPFNRFRNVDGTSQNALVILTPDEAIRIVAGAMAAAAANPEPEDES